MRSATAISTSRRLRSAICGRLVTAPISPRWRRPCAATSPIFSIVPTATGERDGDGIGSGSPMMFDFEHGLGELGAQTVLCVGDLMLDEFVYGEVSRISPEAPAPVIAVARTETSIGGAGNVARNIASLGARCIFVGLIGDDEAGAQLKARLAQEALIESVLVPDASRPTTRKV